MKRTSTRPLPMGNLTIIQALIFSLLLGLAGLFFLNFINPQGSFFGILSKCSFFGLLSIILYVLAYTPLKRFSTTSVFIGAIPGAIPFLLGWVAATDDFELYGGTLFAIQFFWQFPHFWAIAWVCYDDYKLAGFNLLPSKKGKSKNSAYQMVIWSIALIPFSLLLNKITIKPTEIQTEVMPKKINFSPSFSEYCPIEPANLFPTPIAAK